MTEIVTTVYERGVLRPLHPIDLHEHQTVRLQILPEAGDDVESVGLPTDNPNRHS